MKTINQIQTIKDIIDSGHGVTARFPAGVLNSSEVKRNFIAYRQDRYGGDFVTTDLESVDFETVERRAFAITPIQRPKPEYKVGDWVYVFETGQVLIVTSTEGENAIWAAQEIGDDDMLYFFHEVCKVPKDFKLPNNENNQ